MPLLRRTNRAPAALVTLGRRLLMLLASIALVVSSAADVGAQGTNPESGGADPAAPVATNIVPAFRAADHVVVITIRGEINAVTELSVKRRIREAEAMGADAIVFDLNTPGGAVGAVLEITNAIKSSSVANTVAWVHPTAYSGGAVIALACSEIVTTDPANMGDAFIVFFERNGLRGLTADERTKLLPPLLTEVTDSARRNGYDEYLAQAIVTDGIELWAVRKSDNDPWIFISESEYKILFEGEPIRGKPELVSVPGGRTAGGPLHNPEPDATEEPDESGKNAETPDQDSTTPDRATPDDTGDTAEPSESGLPSSSDDELIDERKALRPASESLNDVYEATSEQLSQNSVDSTRPTFTAADRGTYTQVRYIADGSSAIVLTSDQMRTYGVSSAIVGSDAELLAYFGATHITRLDRNWSEHMVAFLTNTAVQTVLLIVFLIALFIEMMSPGLALPGAIALAALGGLLIPTALIGMAGWWEFLAIGVGFVCILIEVFVLPGFGVFGVIGITSLFIGLVGVFIPSGTSHAPSSPGSVAYAMSMVLLALFVAGIGMYFIAKHFGSIPFMNRLVLADATHDADEASEHADLRAIAPNDPLDPYPGATATTRSDLRPSGMVDYNDRLIDAVADYGMIPAGTRVRFIGRRGFEWAVEPVGDEPDTSDPDSPVTTDDAEGLA